MILFASAASVATKPERSETPYSKKTEERGESRGGPRSSLSLRLRKFKEPRHAFVAESATGQKHIVGLREQVLAGRIRIISLLGGVPLNNAQVADGGAINFSRNGK